MECINTPRKRHLPGSVPPSLGEGGCMFHGEPLPHFKSRDFSPGPTGNGSKPGSCSPASHQGCHTGTITEFLPVSARVTETLKDTSSTSWIKKIAFNSWCPHLNPSQISWAPKHSCRDSRRVERKNVCEWMWGNSREISQKRQLRANPRLCCVTVPLNALLFTDEEQLTEFCYLYVLSIFPKLHTSQECVGQTGNGKEQF